MILIDTNQFLIARFSVWIAAEARGKTKPEIDLSEEARWNFGLRCRASLRAMIERIGRQKEEPAFLCLESPRTWRTEIFPPYRYKRILSRVDSVIPWSTTRSYLDAAISYMSNEFPPLRVEAAEGDDIIGAVCEEYGVYKSTPGAHDIVIISTDKDFRQLLKFWNVQLYNPDSGKWVRIEGDNPASVLLDHILSGDSSDGIPNILSPDDTYVRGARSKPLWSARRKALLEATDPSSLLTSEENEFLARNRRLIDLSMTPETIKTAAINAIRPHLSKEKQ